MIPDPGNEADDFEPDITMLVVEDGADGLSIDDPSGRLSVNERVGLMFRGFLQEVAGDIADLVIAFQQDDDE